MKNLKKTLHFILGIIALTSIISSCNSPTPNENLALSLKSRAVAGQEAYPDVYHYKTIAAFVKGEQIGEQKNQSFADKQLSVCVMYDTDTPWAEAFKTRSATVAQDEEPTGSHQFNKIIKDYQFKVSNQFQVDGYNECLILDFEGDSKDIIQACSSISTIDHVLVVKVKEWPSLNSVNASTAASTKNK